MVAALLPGLELANYRPAVLTIGLQIRGSLDQVDGRAQLASAGSDLQRRRERAAQGGGVALGVLAVGDVKPRLGVERMLRQRLLELTSCRARVPGPGEHVCDTRRDLLPVRAPRLQSLELGDGGLVVVPRERTVEVDLRVGIEVLQACRDPVGFRGGPAGVERLEVRVQRRRVVGKSRAEVCQRAHLLTPPREPAVEPRQLLEHLWFAARLVGEPSERIDRFREAVLLGVVEYRRQARSPQTAVARQRAIAQSATLRAARVFREGGVAADEQRGHLQRQRPGVQRRDERLHEGRGDVVHLLRVRRVGRERRLDGGAGEAVAALRRSAYVVLQRVHVGEDLRRRQRPGFCRVAVGVEARRRSLGVEQPHARRRCDEPRQHAMTPVAHEHMRPEALPGAPLFDATRQDERVVDPYLDGALHGDDELAFAARRKERLAVEDAVRDLLVGHGQAAGGRDGQHVRQAAAHRVSRPRRGPRLRRLGGETAQTVLRAAVAEGPREAHRARAAHSPHDLRVVGLARSFGLVVHLERAPVFKLGHGAPPDMTGSKQQGVERAAVSRVELGDRAPEAHQMTRCEPAD